jgi:hypothetical protein
MHSPGCWMVDEYGVAHDCPALPSPRSVEYGTSRHSLAGRISAKRLLPVERERAYSPRLYRLRPGGGSSTDSYLSYERTILASVFTQFVSHDADSYFAQNITGSIFLSIASAPLALHPAQSRIRRSMSTFWLPAGMRVLHGSCPGIGLVSVRSLVCRSYCGL